MKVSPNSQLSIPSSSPLSTQWVTQSVSQSAETMTGRTWYRHHHHTSYYYHLLGWHNFRSIKVEKWFLTMPKMLILFKFLYPHSSSGASATVLGRERGEVEKQWHHPLWGNRHHQQSTNHPPPSTLVIHVAKYNNKKNTFSCSYFRFAFIKGCSPSLPHTLHMVFASKGYIVTQMSWGGTGACLYNISTLFISSVDWVWFEIVCVVKITLLMVPIIYATPKLN